MLVNGVLATGGNGFLSGWDTLTPDSVISLTPGASDFAFIYNGGASTIEVGFHFPAYSGVPGMLYLSGPIGSATWDAQTTDISIVAAQSDVPEPASAVLLGIGLIALAARRRQVGRAKR